MGRLSLGRPSAICRKTEVAARFRLIAKIRMTDLRNNHASCKLLRDHIRRQILMRKQRDVLIVPASFAPTAQAA
jgi:hypothetical protein